MLQIIYLCRDTKKHKTKFLIVFHYICILSSAFASKCSVFPPSFGNILEFMI